ncbi:hypothetical protein [Rhizobium leguminosarum]
MRWPAVLIAAMALTGTAFAAPVDLGINVTADPATECGPNAFCPLPSVPGLIFRYDRKIQGDVVVWRCVGCRGEVLTGLPSWLRKVPTSYGYDLVGQPQPGKFRTKSYYGGVYHPTLDDDYTFIPQ